MSDSSPNGLQLQSKPRVARMGRWPLYAGIGALFIMVAALVYSVNFAHDNDKEEEAKKATIREEEKPVWLVEGSGLALDPKKEQTTGLIAPPRKEEPIVIIQQDTKKQEQIDQEAENIRRVRTQAFLSALASPLAVKRENRDQSRSADDGTASDGGVDNAVSTPGAAGSEYFYDPAADRDKEAFFNRAKKDLSWELKEQRTAGLPLELKTGAVVPGVMLTGINCSSSDLI